MRGAAERDHAGSLADRRILVVEDEYFVARELVALLADAGAEVIGPFPSLAQAALEALCDPASRPRGLERDSVALAPQPRLAAARIDGAVLDVNLGGEMVWPLVDALVASGVPVVLCTGYSDFAIPPRYADLPRCEKPVDRRDLLALLRR